MIGPLKLVVLRNVADVLEIKGPLNVAEFVESNGAAMVRREEPLKFTAPLVVVNPLANVTFPFKRVGPLKLVVFVNAAELLLTKAPLKVAVPVDSNGAAMDTGDDPLKNTLPAAFVKPLLKRTGALLVTLPNIWMGAENKNVTGALNVVVLLAVTGPLKVLVLANRADVLEINGPLKVAVLVVMSGAAMVSGEDPLK